MSDFTSIYISGNLISYDLLDRFDRDIDNVAGQKAKDFGFESSANMRQEIGRAWEDASRQWLAFKSRIERLKETDKGTTETRTHWMMPFFNILGYNPEFQKESEIVGEKLYEISHRDISRDNFPILIISFRDALDKRPEGSRLRMSPHALVQDYLNNTEHTFGLVTNGLQLRLLRDTGRISKPVYAEFNLEKIFDESLYAEFVLLYRLLHSSRMPLHKEQASESFIEIYHQDAIESGGRIRDQLSVAMEQSIKILGKGLIQHPLNNELRQLITDGKFNEEQYYRVLLRLIYRVLFLMTIEERKLVYPEKPDADTQRYGKIYDICYSIERLRKLAGNRHRVEGKHHDLWVRLMQTLRLFEEDKLAQQLGLHALGTGLFERGKTSPFDSCKVTNEVLLDALFRLSYFENESRTMQRINYRQLDVEEFGSVYQGLLDYKISFEKSLPAHVSRWDIALQGSKDRGKSGTHYTPEELVQPLIKHSLDYLIVDRKKIIDEQIKNKNLKGPGNRNLREELVNQHLLTLKICDVACGSGHILISAARRVAEVCAAIIEEEEQPNPTALRKAKREVIRQCIYGVDMNPMAVELCKVALWLEAHNPCEPLNFLDHHIKCGDAIVGLAHMKELEKGIATEAFKALPDDDKIIASALAKKNKQEVIQKGQTKIDFEEDYDVLFDTLTAAFDLWKRLPEKTPEDIQGKQKLYEKLTSGAQQWKIKTLANMQVAQFFIPKTTANKDLLITDAEYQKHFKSKNAIQTQASAKATGVATEKKFFHWFIEFPEVFKDDAGFDCILGNPPFLGGQKLSGVFGNDYLQWLKTNYEVGAVDLVAYFYRRIFSIVKNTGYQSLISTNTVAQGGTREAGLEIIQTTGGVINHAIKSMKWPGLAAVEISLVTIFKGKWLGGLILNGKEAKNINSYLDDSEATGKPFSLIQNEGKCFQGSIVLGQGFVLEMEEGEKLMKMNPQNKDVLFPYLNGEELNNIPNQSPSRWVINFFDWPLGRMNRGEWDELDSKSQDKILKIGIFTSPNYSDPVASDYPDCLSIVERLVKPEREREGNEMGRIKWWQYYRRGVDLYNSISGLEKVIAICEVTKHLPFSFIGNGTVYSANLDVFALNNYSNFTLIQNSFHYYWAWTYCAWLKRDLKYSPGNGFQTFPFPQELSSAIELDLEQVGREYHEHRKQLMILMRLGLTKTYNLFHRKNLLVTEVEKVCKQDAEIAAKGLEGILILRELHEKMDKTVLSAYRWNDISLRHDFYEVDYLPENDRIRFTIHPDARKEILKRLLELNHKIHDEEVKAGLFEKKKPAKEKKEKKEKKTKGADLFDLEL